MGGFGLWIGVRLVVWWGHVNMLGWRLANMLEVVGDISGDSCCDEVGDCFRVGYVGVHF